MPGLLLDGRILASVMCRAISAAMAAAPTATQWLSARKYRSVLGWVRRTAAKNAAPSNSTAPDGRKASSAVR